MAPHDSSDVEIDLCSRCGGIFLDPGESDARGIPLERVFAVASHAVHDHGPSLRPCARHGVPMRRVQIATPEGAVDIERAPCCGAVFLDVGEETALAQAVKAIGADQGPTYDELVSRGFQPPPDLRPSVAPRVSQVFPGLVRGLAGAAQVRLTDAPEVTRSARHCPRCHTTYDQSRADDVEIDVCPGCGSLFLDGGEADARGVDLRGIFGDGPEAASVQGPSTLRCPVHDAPMTRVHVKWIGGLFEIERADDCCGGLFFDDGEWDAFVRASRVALSQLAERSFRETGEFAGEDAIRSKIAEAGGQIEAAVVSGAAARASQHLAFWRAVRYLRRRHGEYHW
ncbi:MAG: zf-TFIIB domain-containing protein [Myxococcales bacterium]|nr:zf-TFIIB domain-containing protein [Myxococcales bacterium]